LRKLRARKKPECYSPGRTKSYAEIAENDCFTCPERVTCLEFVAEVKEMADAGLSTNRQPPPLPTTGQIIALAASTGLAHEDSYGTVYLPYDEGTDIRDIVVDFATKLLYTYGNLP
jgi:hypothetical protein